jgi:hypothetical protein
MGELIDFQEYKRKKEQSEVASLMAELRDIMQGIGGFHVIPIHLMGDDMVNQFLENSLIAESSLYLSSSSQYSGSDKENE